MTNNKENLAPDETVLYRSRPAWRSFWVFIFGLLLCIVGPLTSEDPPISLKQGIIFSSVFLLIILRRLSDVFTLTNKRLMVRGGLFMRETYAINLEDISGVQLHQGITLRMVKAGHLWVSSRQPDQESIILNGQLAPEELKARIETLAAEARGESETGEDPEE